MRILLLLVFLSPFFLLAQSTKIEAQIDSISYTDTSTTQRDFVIYYHIKNNTNHLVRFIQNPTAMRPNATNSLAIIPSYNLYQEGKPAVTAALFNTKKTEAFYEQMRNDLMANKANLDQFLKKEQSKLKTQQSKDIIKNRILLNPNETKAYSIRVSWDKKRYLQDDDNEYYIDEKANYYLDLHINLFKVELYSQLLPEDLKTISNDNSILMGWIQTNKMFINFKE